MNKDFAVSYEMVNMVQLFRKTTRGRPGAIMCDCACSANRLNERD